MKILNVYLTFYASYSKLSIISTQRRERLLYMRLLPFEKLTESKSIHIKPELFPYLGIPDLSTFEPIKHKNPFWLRELDLNPFKALSLLGLDQSDVSFLQANSEYYDRVRETSSWALFPLAVLTFNLNEVLSHSAYNNTEELLVLNDLYMYHLQHSEIPLTLNEIIPSEGDLSEVISKEAIYFMGSGYSNSPEPVRGSPLVRPRLINLDTGDQLLVLVYIWE